MKIVPIVGLLFLAFIVGLGIFIRIRFTSKLPQPSYRLSLSASLLFVVVGAALLALVYLAVKFLPGVPR